MQTETANYSGSITAIAAIIVSVVARLDPSLNLQTNDVITIMFGLITIGGVIKQMVDHKKVVNTVNAVTDTQA